MVTKKRETEQQPLTLSQFIQFYEQKIEPRFQKLEEKLETEIANLRHEMHQHFDAI
jgi:hypothetical protein